MTADIVERVLELTGPSPTEEELILLLYPPPHRWTLQAIGDTFGISYNRMTRTSVRLQRHGKLKLRTRQEASSLYLSRKRRGDLSMTCDDCLSNGKHDGEDKCPYAFALYDADGDCLGEK